MSNLVTKEELTTLRARYAPGALLEQTTLISDAYHLIPRLLDTVKSLQAEIEKLKGDAFVNEITGGFTSASKKRRMRPTWTVECPHCHGSVPCSSLLARGVGEAGGGDAMSEDAPPSATKVYRERTCPMCEGEGKVTVYWRSHPPDWKMEGVTERCEGCRGTGVLREEVKGQ